MPRQHMIQNKLIDSSAEPFDLELAEYVPASFAEKFINGQIVSSSDKMNYPSKGIIFYTRHEVMVFKSI